MGSVVKFSSRVIGDVGSVHFVAHPRISLDRKGECKTCGGNTRQSPVTGILHTNCYGCRKLIMVYGPNIRVTRR